MNRAETTQQGFTFLEVMVTVIILATGIVTIYKGFLLTLDQQRYLSHRLYADHLLDQKIQESQHLSLEERKSAHEEIFVEKAMIHNQEIPFEIRMYFRDISGLPNALQLDIGVSWIERGRRARLARSATISR